MSRLVGLVLFMMVALVLLGFVLAHFGIVVAIGLGVVLLGGTCAGAVFERRPRR